MFQFKQFAVDQAGCAMKINTDGVLLGALANAYEPENILDIGTGTGVIALMLAQRFTAAQIDAVEINKTAAETAARNFSASHFSERITGYHCGFEEFLDEKPEAKYDLIVSNPPFYINSLKSPGAGKSQAKHADRTFFETLIRLTSQHLTGNGLLWLVLPVETSQLVHDIASGYMLCVKEFITVKSYDTSEPHRHILALSTGANDFEKESFVIYDSPKQYSRQYQTLMQPFFTIF